MKKLLYAVILIGFTFTLHAQQDGLRAGLHIGLPLSDAKDFSSLNAGADVSYHFRIKDNIAIGAATGYSSFLGKDDFDNYSFLPIAFSGRVAHDFNLYYGGDVGYAISLENGTDGGLYYQTKIGWSHKTVDAYLFYKGVSSDNSLSAIGLGFAYKFKL